MSLNEEPQDGAPGRAATGEMLHVPQIAAWATVVDRILWISLCGFNLGSL